MSWLQPAGIAWLRESNIPDRDRDIGDAAVLAMLDDEVRVKRDRQGVPYIYAETLADALRVQGFVTAQDRLSQMLITPRTDSRTLVRTDRGGRPA